MSIYTFVTTQTPTHTNNLSKSDQPTHSKTLRPLGSGTPIYLTPFLNRVFEFETNTCVLVQPWRIAPPKGLNSRPGMALMLCQVPLADTSKKPSILEAEDQST